MLIDWFTVGAQIVNFLILVWLLKRFLYRPILDAIDGRERRIASELADAAAKMAEAETTRGDFARKGEAFEQQRATLLKQATDAAKAERHRLMEEARQAAEALSAKRMQTLSDEVHNLNQAIGRRAQQEVFGIARKALTGLASVSLEERMVEVFIRRLRDLDRDTRENFAKALGAGSEAALVRSAFDLPLALQGAVQQALGETFGREVHVAFQTAPDLVSGIEVTASGQKVAWSIAHYLASLEKSAAAVLKDKDMADAQAQQKTSSWLTQKIGERAYELYEEHGRRADHAVEDLQQAEREMHKEIHKPGSSGATPALDAGPDTRAEAKPESDAKSESSMESKASANIAAESVAKAGPPSSVESKSPSGAGSRAEADVQPATKSP